MEGGGNLTGSLPPTEYLGWPVPCNRGAGQPCERGTKSICAVLSGIKGQGLVVWTLVPDHLPQVAQVDSLAAVRA